jgi:hypothetical protein
VRIRPKGRVMSSVQGVTGTNIDRVKNLLFYSSQVVIKETSNM